MMLPTDQPQASSWFDTCLQKVQDWVRQEIVDDDPWDVETLFPTSAASNFESSERQPRRSKENLEHSRR